jgi:hypothetical protein
LGLLPGANLSGLQGCFDLSNAITIYKNNYEGGSITSLYGNEVDLCISNGYGLALDVFVSSSTGTYNKLAVTDLNGTVLSLPASNSVEFNSINNETCLIWNLSYETILPGLSTGVSIFDLDACYGISDSIVVNKTVVDGGILLSDQGSDVVLCDDGTTPLFVNFDLTQNTGINSKWILYSQSGEILELRADPYFDFSQNGYSICHVVHISFGTDISGLSVGSNISLLSACYDLSNSIRISKLNVYGGLLESNYGTDISFCTNDGNSDNVEFLVSSSTGAFNQLFITDSGGTITDILNSN